MTAWLIYGATGYTGRLLARTAVRRGHTPVLAGRSRPRLQQLATELGLPVVVTELTGLANHLDGIDVVVHCAGPFELTWRPVFEACLATATHYLDITGELTVLEAIHSYTEQAAAAGIVAVPGAGFDVVPTDCAAGLAAAALPGASCLDLAIWTTGGASPGTAHTAWEHAGRPGWARVDGHLQPVPLGHRTDVFDFPSGPRRAAAIPWGDLATAHRSTGIATVTTFAALPRAANLVRPIAAATGPLLRLPPVRRLGHRLIDRVVAGRSDQQLTRSTAEVVARVRRGERSAQVALRCPDPYLLTVDAVLAAVDRVSAAPVGTQTPAQAFGADFVTGLPDVHVVPAIPVGLTEQ